MNKITTYTVGMLSLILTFPTYSQPASEKNKEKYILVAPTCLIKGTNIAHKIYANKNELKLIEVDQKNFDKIVEYKKFTAPPCGSFINVTENWNAIDKTPGRDANALLASYSTPKATVLSKFKPLYNIQYPNEVKQLFRDIEPEAMWENLTTLTNFKDRYADSDNGVKAAAWVKTEVELMSRFAGRRDVKTYYVKTGSRYKQPSLVVKIGDTDEPAVILGAHLDTLSSFAKNKPGADDDGTGSVTLLEIARIIINEDFVFRKPIYLIWYAAEEVGLVGSHYVVEDFKDKKIPVASVMQLDMTGYAYKNAPTIWLMKDYVNPDLTAFLEKLVNEYVKQPVKYTNCGYACSDHASWYFEGFVTAMPFESQMGKDNPYIHTSEDKMEVLSLDHMTDYTKLALAYLVELAEPYL